jgi:glucose-1-phosphate cytidylyltransferase
MTGENVTPQKNVPIFILAGGLGTRLSEETHLRPKPMIEIGDFPILLHIMRWYYSFGFNDFVICAGYRSWEIKQFFLNYEFRQNHLAIDHRETLTRPPEAFGNRSAQENWRVRVVDTGLSSMTGARVAIALDTIKDQPFETFGLTYGDGVCDADLNAEFAFHNRHKRIGTVLGVHPRARFGELDVAADGQVTEFLEKPQSRQGYINGGFFFFNRGFREFLTDDASCILERQPLCDLADKNQLMMFKHEGFWQPMDTLRDKMELQDLWMSGKAPWEPKPTAAIEKKVKTEAPPREAMPTL